MKDYIVSMRVDGRIDIRVKAKNAKEAFEKAENEFMDADMRKVEVIDSSPVNAYDVANNECIDYE